MLWVIFITTLYGAIVEIPVGTTFCSCCCTLSNKPYSSRVQSSGVNNAIACECEIMYYLPKKSFSPSPVSAREKLLTTVTVDNLSCGFSAWSVAMTSRLKELCTSRSSGAAVWMVPVTMSIIK